MESESLEAPLTNLDVSKIRFDSISDNLEALILPTGLWKKIKLPNVRKILFSRFTENGWVDVTVCLDESCKPELRIHDNVIPSQIVQIPYVQDSDVLCTILCQVDNLNLCQGVLDGKFSPKCCYVAYKTKKRCEYCERMMKAHRVTKARLKKYQDTPGPMKQKYWSRRRLSETLNRKIKQVIKNCSGIKINDSKFSLVISCSYVSK